MSVTPLIWRTCSRIGLAPRGVDRPASGPGTAGLTDRRYRQELVRLRTGCTDQVHAVLAKLGVPVVPAPDVFGVAGSASLDGLGLPRPYAGKVTSAAAADRRSSAPRSPCSPR